MDERRLAVCDLRVELLPPRRLLRGTPAAGGSAPTRSTSRCASARGRRTAARCGRSRWSGRWRRSSCSRTSPRHRHAEVRALATSAIREASNRDDFLGGARWAGLKVRGPLARRGGPLRLSRGDQHHDAQRRRGARPRRRLDAAHTGGGPARDDRVSWRLGAVSRRSASSPTRGSSASRSRRSRARPRGARLRPLARARRTVSSPASAAPIRNLAAAAHPGRSAQARPTASRGSGSSAARSTTLVDTLADMTPAERRHVPGIKPERGDVILGGAVVMQSVMELGGFDELEARCAVHLLRSSALLLSPCLRSSSCSGSAASPRACRPTCSRPCRSSSWSHLAGTSSEIETRRRSTPCRPRRPHLRAAMSFAAAHPLSNGLVVLSSSSSSCPTMGWGTLSGSGAFPIVNLGDFRLAGVERPTGTLRAD